jgi:hypothetical protein
MVFRHAGSGTEFDTGRVERPSACAQVPGAWHRIAITVSGAIGVTHISGAAAPGPGIIAA